MIDNEFKTVGLYEHNANSYRKIKVAFERGENVVGIVHATGTGKSYNALELAFDNKDKKIVYVVPSNGIIEHIKKIIEDNPNFDLQRDFPNLEFRTYRSFVNMSKEELKNLNVDLLILDEFHHIGAPVWGTRVDTIIETHPNMKIFGMTAYTVRDRGTPYERDMANPDTDELFSNRIVSRYDLCDAMIDGVLPKPIYKSAYANLLDIESNLEKRVRKLDENIREYQDCMKILLDVKRRIQEAPSIPNILKRSIKPNGKYIYFCPPCSEAGTNDIETIKKQALEWFKQFVPEEDIVFYTSTSEMGESGKLNREAFYDDVTLDGKNADNKLRIMFAINQYNEGIHAPNIDGVIMGRGTTSDIVYFEQLGRALAVRGNTREMVEELEKHTIEELIEMCKFRDIPIKDGMVKEELIERLIAPIVIDLTNNYEFIKELENNLKNRIKEIQSKGQGHHRDIKLKDASFDIEIENQDLYEMLRYVSDRLTRTWEDYYELAKIYYEHHGDLLVPTNFKTNDGYTFDKNGTVNLGSWISNQRYNFLNLTEKRQQLLKSIGFVLNALENEWQQNYELAKIYYEHHGDLLVPYRFKTNDGYTDDENGTFNLGSWIHRQRKNFNKLSVERKQMLQKMGFVLDALEAKWQQYYELAKIYYEHHDNLLVPINFKTNDGYTDDENGTFNLGSWIQEQRRNFNKLSVERKQMLQKIGFVLDALEAKWQQDYELAKIYYEHHGDLLVPYRFKTNDGYTDDKNGTVNLGSWIANQRHKFFNLTEKRQQLLKSIGFVSDTLEDKWQQNYELAKIYYEHHGDLLVPNNFKTSDGYTYDRNGTVNLGKWISNQRRKFFNLAEKRQQLLKSIGFVLDAFEDKWQQYYELAKIYYEHHGDLLVPQNFKTNDGYTDNENGTVNLGVWIVNQRYNFFNLTKKRQQLLKSIGFILDALESKWQQNYELAKTYYEHYGNLLVPQNFKTSDGYTDNKNGTFNLGSWIQTQRRTCSIDSERGQLLSSIGRSGI